MRLSRSQPVLAAVDRGVRHADGLLCCSGVCFIVFDCNSKDVLITLGCRVTENCTCFGRIDLCASLGSHSRAVVLHSHQRIRSECRKCAVLHMLQPRCSMILLNQLKSKDRPTQARCKRTVFVPSTRSDVIWAATAVIQHALRERFSESRLFRFCHRIVSFLITSC